MSTQPGANYRVGAWLPSAGSPSDTFEAGSAMAFMIQSLIATTPGAPAGAGPEPPGQSQQPGRRRARQPSTSANLPLGSQRRTDQAGETSCALTVDNFARRPYHI